MLVPTMYSSFWDRAMTKNLDGISKMILEEFCHTDVFIQIACLILFCCCCSNITKLFRSAANLKVFEKLKVFTCSYSIHVAVNRLMCMTDPFLCSFFYPLL